MKKTNWRMLTLVLFAVLSAALRVGQERTGFDKAGLAVRGNLFGLLLPIMLLAAAAYCVWIARVLPAGRGKAGGYGDSFAFGGMAAVFCAVSGAFLLLASAAAAFTGHARSTRMALLALPAAVAALCVLYVAFALYRGNTVSGMVLLAPVCCLIAYLVFLCRVDASDPVLARVYVEILAVSALTLSAIEHAAFAFRCGAPRVWFVSSAMAAVLSAAAAVEGRSLASLLLFGGCALIEFGFLAAAERDRG